MDTDYTVAIVRTTTRETGDNHYNHYMSGDTLKKGMDSESADNEG